MTEHTKMEAMVRKVQALLNTKGCSEAEAQARVAKAQELVEAYGLDVVQTVARRYVAMRWLQQRNHRRQRVATNERTLRARLRKDARRMGRGRNTVRARLLIRVWRCADGRRIPINQMSRSHILNCIAKIQNSKRGWRRRWLEPLQLELTIRDIQGRP